LALFLEPDNVFFLTSIGSNFSATMRRLGILSEPSPAAYVGSLPWGTLLLGHSPASAIPGGIARALGFAAQGRDLLLGFLAAPNMSESKLSALDESHAEALADLVARPRAVIWTRLERSPRAFVDYFLIIDVDVSCLYVAENDGL
jgi:hypothetical protein